MINCITLQQITELEEKYDVKGLNPLMDINDLKALETYLDTVTNLKKIRTKSFDKFKQLKEEVITLSTLKEKLQEQEVKKRSFVTLKTGTDKKDKERNYNYSQLKEFSELFNSAFITLYNDGNLTTLLEKENSINKESANTNFYNFLNEFLNEDNKKILKAIKTSFATKEAAYGDYEKNDATKLFYIKEVFPFMMDFLSNYYNDYFWPEIWNPVHEEVSQNKVSTIAELTKINPEYGNLSTMKDLIVGSIISYNELVKQLLDKKPSTQEEYLNVVNNSSFNKVAESIMASFKYNTKMFNEFDNLNEELNKEEDDEKDIANSNDETRTRDGFTSSGNEKSGFTSSSIETKTTLSSLFEVGENHVVATDKFGFPKFVNELEAFKTLSKILRGAVDYSEFYNLLIHNQQDYKFISQLLDNYLILDPEEDINDYFEEYDLETLSVLQKIKQAFMQDLTKDKIQAKEISLNYSKKSKPSIIDPEKSVTYYTLDAQVFDSKSKSTVEIKKQNTTRFFKEYQIEKQKVFGSKLFNNAGTVKISALSNAMQVVQDIKDKKKVTKNNLLNALAVFGIVPKNLKYKDLVKALNTITPKETELLNKGLKELIVAVKNKEVKLNNFKDITSDVFHKEADIKKLKKEYLDPLLIEDNESINNLFNEFLNNINTLEKEKKSKNEYVKLVNEFITNVEDVYENLQRDLLQSLTSDSYWEIFKNLTNPEASLKEKFGKLYEEYNKLENQYILEDDNIIDLNGKPRYLVQSLNNLLIKSRDINTGNIGKMLMRFPELDPRLNPLISSSHLFNSIFEISNDGLLTKQMDAPRITINSILGIKLKSRAVSSGSLSLNNQYEQDQLVSSMLLLLSNGYEESMNVDKEAVYNINFQGISHPGNKKLSNKDNFLMVPVNLISNLFNRKLELRDNKPYLSLKYKSNQEVRESMSYISDIYNKYLAHYLLMYYEIEKGNLQYVKNEYKNLSTNYKDLGLFEKDSSLDPDNYIIDAGLKDIIKEKVLELDLSDKSILEKSEILQAFIKNIKFKSVISGNKTISGENSLKDSLYSHFKAQVEAGLKVLKYSENKDELKSLVDMLLGKKNGMPYYNQLHSSPLTEDSVNIKGNFILNDKSLLRGLLMTYVVNYNLLAQEKMLMFYGDGMFLKKSSYVKRASTPGSTGSYALIDDFDIEYYNHPKNYSAFAFAKELNRKLLSEGKPGLDMSKHKLGYRYRYGITNDNVVKSQVYKQLYDGFIESIKLKYGNRFTNKEIEEKAKIALDSYNVLNEADGYGVITLDWYKIFSELTKTWSKEQDRVYQLLAKGEKVPYKLLNVTFPVRKFQYSGSIFSDESKLPADGFHKFSLAPILPGSDNNLQTKNENLIKEGKAYEIFESANKKENLTKPNGKLDDFYDGDRVIKPIEADSEGNYISGRQTLYAITNLIKDQVHIDTKIKDKVILARQLKRIIKTDLFENGIPVDYKGTIPWQSLSEKEKLSSSKIYKIYRDVVNNIDKINKSEKETVLKKLGLEVVGKNKLKVIEGTGKKQLLNTIKSELRKKVEQQKTGGSNVYLKLLQAESKFDDAELEAFVNLRAIKSIIKNIIDKEIKFRKFNGSNLVQSPVTGMEPKQTFDKENIISDSTGYLKTYKYGAIINKAEIERLEKERKKEPSTEIDEKIEKLKSTTMAEVMVPLTKEWDYLLSLPYKDGKLIGTIERLNTILKEDKNWVEENRDKLTMLAVRIPIQDPNSIEAFIVKEFLPLSSGSKIVVPSEIVAKSGGDFDIDKLMVYYYNTNKNMFGEYENTPFDNSPKGLENKIIKGYFDLLLLPEMYYKLITSNSVAVLKDENRKEGEPAVEIVDVLNDALKSNTIIYDNTDLRMPLFNIRQKTTLQIAKKLLGHAATTRSNFEELKHSGFLLSKVYSKDLFQFIKKEDRKIIGEEEVGKLQESNKQEVKIRIPLKMEDGSIAYNTTGDQINLSESFSKDKKSITEIISALMNGFVDVASKPWISIFRMNEKLTSFNFMMLMAGVPAKMTFKINNQQIIKDYMDNELEISESLYKRVFNKDNSTDEYRLLGDVFSRIIEDHVTYNEDGQRVLDIEKLKNMFKALGAKEDKHDFIFNYLDTYIENDENKKVRITNKILFNRKIQSFLLEAFNSLKEDEFISDEELFRTLGKEYYEMSVEDLSNQIKLLAFTVFIKPVASGLTNLLDNLDHDKSKSEFIHQEYNRVNSLTQLKRNGYFDKDSLNSLIKMHISTPYNLTDFTKEIASILTPITDNKNINNYAIRLSKNLLKEYYILYTKKDSVINSFKNEFLNFIIQNYGTMEKDGVKMNIVEYFVKNGIFVDINKNSKLLKDKPIQTQLFSILKMFNKFDNLDVFKYLIPIQSKRIEEEDGLDFIYKIGREFRDLTPVELDDYNKQVQIFQKTPIKVKDVIESITENGAEILNQFLDEIPEQVLNNTITSEEELKEKKELYKLFQDITYKINQVKDEVTYVLPYMSLLQSTAEYSNTSISNLFIEDNYNILKEAIDNFKNSVNMSDPDVMVNLYKNFTILFLLNNTNFLKSDKKYKLLMAISPNEDFKNNSLIQNSNYFQNYYTKTFKLSDPTFTNEESVLDKFLSTNSTFLTKLLEKPQEEILDEVEEDEPIYTTYESDRYEVITLKDNSYDVDVVTEEIKDRNGNILKPGVLRNEILVNYYDFIEKLKISLDGQYFIIKDKIFTLDFKEPNISQEEKNNIIEKAINSKC